MSEALQLTEFDDSRRILILTSDAGFGHRSAALAIEAAMKERYGDRCVIKIINPLREEGIPSILQRVAEERHDLYMQNELGYELGFRITDSAATSALIEQIISALMRDSLKELLYREQPQHHQSGRSRQGAQSDC